MMSHIHYVYVPLLATTTWHVVEGAYIALSNRSTSAIGVT